MKIANEFTVSAPIEDAWDVLTDLEQVIPLMPGAQMTGREGDDVLGKVKVKVGPGDKRVQRQGALRRAESRRAPRRHRRQGQGGARYRQRGRDRHRAAARRGRSHPGHRRHRPEDRRQARPVRQRHAAAGVGEAARASSSTRWRRSWLPDTRTRAAPPHTSPPRRSRRSAARPKPSPIDLLELAGGGALKKYGPPVFGAFLLAAVVFTLGRLRIARKALRRQSMTAPFLLRGVDLAAFAVALVAGCAPAVWSVSAGGPAGFVQAMRHDRAAVAAAAVLGGAADAGEPGRGSGGVRRGVRRDLRRCRARRWIRRGLAGPGRPPPR